MLKDVVAGIICGMERSGTTFTKEILSCHPDVETGGPEIGLFLTDNPACFDEQHILPPNRKVFDRHWKFPMTDLNGSSSYEEAFRRMWELCPHLKGPQKWLIDKCPAYCRYLGKVLKRSEDLPVVLVRKDARSWTHSIAKRGESMGNIQKLLELYALVYGPQCANMLRLYGKRLLVFQFEDFVTKPIEASKTLYEHFDLDFKPEYVEETLSEFDAERVIDVRYELSDEHMALVKRIAPNFMVKN